MNSLSSGVEFPQRSHTTPSHPPASLPTKPNTLNGELASARHKAAAKQAEPQNVPESSFRMFSSDMMLLSGRTTVSRRPTSTPNHFDHEEVGEEDPEQLFRRIRKGKACARPEDEECSREQPNLDGFGSNIMGEKERLNRLLIRTVCLFDHCHRNHHVDGSAVAGHYTVVMLAVLGAGAWISLTNHIGVTEPRDNHVKCRYGWSSLI
ncbi:Detected protein of unknown function [Hibiscus syriacus]|uniref:Uncharacterized protein n=1 Tax=Hibiscus syriacus TaxID=106335 RepID=A0A6A3A7W3_HIBSY|nr:Detected protein of unknown function [Hibiscus syriacus]